MRSKFKFKKVISALLILTLTMTSGFINKSTVIDNSKQTYVVISQESNNKKVTTFSLTSAEAEKMRHLDNILVVEENGYVTGSKNSNRNENWRKLYKKEKHNKSMKMQSSKSSNSEWNMQAIKLNLAVLGEDPGILPELDINVASSPAISVASSPAISVASGAAISAVSGPAISVVSGPAISAVSGPAIVPDNSINMETNTPMDTPIPIPGIVKVAIIDSGIDYSEDIDVYMRKNFVTGQDDVSIIYEDGCGHGTGVAGIIAAKDNGDGISGINPNVQLYSAKVLDESCTAPVSRVVEAIYWAIENNVNIINISFGTPDDSNALKLAIQDAYNAGILLIAAAGNNGIIEYPAAYDEVIAVGSVNSLGDRSSGSATGEKLELMAPGEQILTSGAFGGVMVSSGTSMAAPHVTGIASLLWQMDLSCSSDFIRKLMDFSANRYGNNNEYGYGLVDLECAMKNYHKFKRIYEKNGSLVDNIETAKNYGIIEDNTSDIIVFDDVDYVTGSWGAAHGTINDIISGIPNQVKVAAIKIDEWLGGMYINPQFHGYFANRPTQGAFKYESNYMASYIYLTNAAISIGSNGTIPIPPSYMDSEDAAHIYTILTTKDITDYWYSQSGAVTNEEKKYTLYGVALHTVTDAFAHSAFTARATNSNIAHEGRDPIGADDPIIIGNRFDCALEMAYTLANHIADKEPGSIDDFIDIDIDPDHYSTSTGTYYMANYYKYIKKINGSYKDENTGMSYAYPTPTPTATPTPIPTATPTPKPTATPTPKPTATPTPKPTATPTPASCSHKYYNTCDTTCNSCGATRTITHTLAGVWVPVGTSSMCKRVEVRCSVCGYFTGSVPTCDSTHTAGRYCTDCGYKKY